MDAFGDLHTFPQIPFLSSWTFCSLTAQTVNFLEKTTLGSLGSSLPWYSNSKKCLIVYISQWHPGDSCLLVQEYEIPALMPPSGSNSVTLFLLWSSHRFRLRLEFTWGDTMRGFSPFAAPISPPFTNFSCKHFLNKSPLQEFSSQVLLPGNPNWYSCWFWPLELYMQVSLQFILK